ncbi:MAG TPA: ABC transporter substrate-binding protein [Mesorhizobium sp.]|uniref:ABC transporter substrate-binding protein n=1 Tax=Mesorhizobium sp. TaxID=1871066 RepID=UPI002DDD2CDC|nr:ABC transporter substrate-binding protein [Mesorhizobium sp.]HEV2502755.1 ABC transporter substrate-binding protein [Mesorhizobium sp.]
MHGSSRAAPAGGVVAMDWVSGQNLLALGIAPAAMPELELYASLVVEPALPSATAELGLRSEPNLELVDHLRPALIVQSADEGPVNARLQSIASVCMFDQRLSSMPNRLDGGRKALSELAGRLGASAQFDSFQAGFEAEIAEAKKRLAAYDGRPLIVATVIDGRRLLVFGRNSLFQNVLDLLGIENAWDGHSSLYGHTTVAADRLALYPQARLLCIGDSSGDRLDRLLAAPVIKSLPFVRERHVTRVADVLFYGGLPPARRFARLASVALAEGTS